MKIIVESEIVSTRSGVSQRTNKPYTMREQKALLKGDRLAGEISLQLADDQSPYPVGEYDIDFERSVGLSRFGQLEIRAVVLKAGKPVSVPGFAKTGS